MKKTAALLFILFCAVRLSAQQLQLVIRGASETETKIIEAVQYQKQHPDLKSATQEVDAVSKKLIKIGYTALEVETPALQKDSTYSSQFKLGKKIQYLHLYIGKDSELKKSIFPTENDTVIIPYDQTETFLNNALSRLERTGFAMAKIKLNKLQEQGNVISAEIQIDLNNSRRVDDIVINGYDKFPKGHQRQIKRMYRNRIFNRETVAKVYSDFQKYRFVKQLKYPEILFETDSTKIFVYVEKSKANTFDGFIGFGNDEDQKIRLSGYVDLILNNILNTGENFTLYWKSDGKDQKTFNASAELPYIFKSPFALKGQLNIFKQDSTFQNTKTAIELGYYFNYNMRLYVGYQATESSDIQNSNSASISDFENKFFTANVEYFASQPEDFLFPDKTKLTFKTGLGDRLSNQKKNAQYFLQMEAFHNFYLNDKNSIHLKTQNYYLNSETYIINELFRFGGINSIRGFNENSLQANLFTSLITEYRYVITPGIYAHSIIDYGYYKDSASNIDNRLLTFGFGFGLLTKTGLFNIVYANGNTGAQNVKLSNSIVHISFKTNF